MRTIIDDRSRAGTSTGRVRAEGGCGALLAGLLAAMVLAGCTVPVGTLPRVSDLAATEGYKMLKPGEGATACAASYPWSVGGADLLGTAFRRLLERDDEANLVVNARVESTWWSIGVYGRRCVTLTGDVVRTTSTILLPMPASHGDHGHQ